MQNPTQSSRKVQLRHVALSVAQEALRSRPFHEWIETLLRSLGLVPFLSVPVEVVGLYISLIKRQPLEFGLSLAGLICLPGVCGTVVKIVRRIKKLIQSA